jgi:hypothetical protein
MNLQRGILGRLSPSLMIVPNAEESEASSVEQK